MKLKNMLTLLLIVSLTIILLMSCTDSKKKIYISSEEVSSIKIIYGGDMMMTFTPEVNPKEIEEFLKSYNEGKPYKLFGNSTNSKGKIKLKNGSEILVGP